MSPRVARGDRRPQHAAPAPAGAPRRGAAAGRVVSMRLIMGVAAVAVTASTVFGVGYVAERHARATLAREVEGRLLLEARNLALVAAGALLAEYPELTLFPVVREMRENRQDLAYAVVLDREGRIQGDVDVRRLDTPFDGLAPLRPVPARQALAAGEQLLGDAESLVAAVPVTLADGRQLGTSVVALRLSYLEEQATQARRTLLGLTVLLALLASACGFGLTAYLLQPLAALRDGLARIGRGDLDHLLPVGRTEIGLLAEAVNGMAAQLKASQQQLIEKERLAHEMSLARSIQESLMPKEDTAAGEYAVLGQYQAAAEVGGDYWDVFPRRDGRLGVVIADVAGKGLGGCLVTSMIAVLLRTLREEHDSPAGLLAALESRLVDSLRPGVFVTMFYGLLDPRTGRFTYANAAHTPLLVWRAAEGRLEWRRTRGIPIGAARGSGLLARSLEDATLDLLPGDLLLQFTDGLNETRDAARREEFGLERVGEIVARAASRGAAAVRRDVLSGLAAWTGGLPPEDDLTLLLIGRQTAPGPATVAPEPAPSAAAAEPEVAPAAAAAAPDPTSAAQWRGLLDGFREAPLLTLPLELPALHRLRPWLATLPELAGPAEDGRHLAESALYELCANVIEHGCHGGGAGPIEIRWLPARDGGPACALDAAGPDAGLAGGGWFLIRDRGAAYDLTGWRPPDLADAAVRRRGRGLGLHIVHAATRVVRYLPGTPAGNLTLLRFTPDAEAVACRRDEEETRHV